ncbi:MAG TPA: hypothetical protein VHD83_12070, partial [Puia sp.]|nr:hypothetical protein [Puia sp.]
RDLKMLFKTTSRGFSILVKADATAGPYVSSIDILPATALTFYWTLADPYFENYTNQRLREPEKKIYYFSNRNGTVEGTVLYLNNAIPPFGTAYPGDPAYRLGDIVSQGGDTYAMIDKESPLINFPANIAKWQKIVSGSVVHFINPGCRVRLQSSRWSYQRANTTPGEFITARLYDVDGGAVDTGLIPGSARPQNEYRSSTNSADPVDFSMNLGNIRPGLYRMDVQDSGGTTSFSFFLMDTLVKHDLYGVSEFFVSGAPVALTFTKQTGAPPRWALDDPHKQFQLRWPNRLTRWRYLNQDQTLFNAPPTPRPLTKMYSAYTVAGTQMPDPSVNTIVPDVDPVTKLVQNIFSNIFLPK